MIGWILIVLFLVITIIFLAKEMVKKFRFELHYSLRANVCRWDYPGNEKQSITRGMHTVVLRGSHGKQFTAKIAFVIYLPFGIEGVDTFGCIDSDENGVISFSTYLGRGKCDFRFFITKIDASDVKVSVDPMVAPEPTHVYPPHWWQRLGFWG